MEERLYEQVVTELTNGHRRDGLWAKALANADGEEERTKALYIQYRVQSLKDETELSREEGIETNTHSKTNSDAARYVDIGFVWWQVWAWLGLTIGNLYTFALVQELPVFAIILIVVNTILMIMILIYNKYAFLIATILSLNPLIWIINGIYLRNRWRHPKLNNGFLSDSEQNINSSQVNEDGNLHYEDWLVNFRSNNRANWNYYESQYRREYADWVQNQGDRSDY